MNAALMFKGKMITSPDGSVAFEYMSNEGMKTYKDECEKTKGMKWRVLSVSTYDCTYNGDKTKVTVKNFGLCLADTDSCNEVNLSESLYDELLINGYKCGADGKSMDVSSASSIETPIKLLSFAAFAVASVAMLI